MSAELRVVRAGVVAYDEATRMQAALAAARRDEAVPDTLLCLQHPPVYTKGRRSRPGELPMGEDWYRRQGIEVVETDRGGLVTYHGIGQVVVYPIVSLTELAKPDDVHEYVRMIERAMIAALGEYGVEARVIEGLTGVWVGDDPPPGGDARKIGSIGIHVNRGVTTHGLAINVNNDLQPFEWVVPCGIEAVRMTSLARELGAEQDLERFVDALVVRLAAALGRDPVDGGLEALPAPTGAG